MMCVKKRKKDCIYWLTYLFIVASEKVWIQALIKPQPVSNS